MKRSRILILFGVFLFLLNCTTKYPFCISEKTKNLTIEWGTITKGERKERYVLHSDGILYKFVSPTKKIKVGNLDERKFCRVLAQINETILKTQTINEVGDTLNYLTYTNPTLGMFIDAKWNPSFKTKNSIHFRALYDSLKVMTLEIKD
ncbi:hypothetical protein D9V84_04680 [Bacteroidetes/Chlorobi group bacterium Naka2016]|jgi:hypothetical protein|nr:MAG: hypothetical protein D9V84_04680 [Bacteroidetes/Chlorobi group bacterium Naka2016]